MAWETLPLGAYRVPRDGTDDDEDDIDYTGTTPIAVSQSGTATFKLHVNWPNGLDDIQVTIILPSSATLGTASVSPSQSGQLISTVGDRAIFTHESAAQGTEITYTLNFTAVSAGTFGITFKFDADELVDFITRQVEVVFQ